MNSTELGITIPAAIAAVPGLSLHERTALAYIHLHPRCRNGTLARHLGMKERGVEALLRRMRQLGHIRSVGKGPARRIELLFFVELAPECGVQQKEKHHTSCEVDRQTMAMVRIEPSTEEFADLHLEFAETCAEKGLYKAARNHLEMIRARIGADNSVSSEMKAEMLTHLSLIENCYYAVEAGAEIARKLPRKQMREFTQTLHRATPQQLARIRQLVEANGQLENALEILALPSNL
jgi:DNA-binding CsgD family transcriptional regulator